MNDTFGLHLHRVGVTDADARRAHDIRRAMLAKLAARLQHGEPARNVLGLGLRPLVSQPFEAQGEPVLAGR